MNAVKTFSIAAAVVLAAWQTQAQGHNRARAEYFERYRGIAAAHMDKYGIPASVKMAQGMLESNNGQSRLATEGNNHFGIKCKTGWTGQTIFHDDDAPGECFRRYDTAEESWTDHSEYLDTQPRYQFLFDLDPTDYAAWAHGLKQAGYATDREYAAKLIRIIEDNRLYLLDRGEELSLGAAPAREHAQGAPPAMAAAEGEVDIDHYTIATHRFGGREVLRTAGGLFVAAREGDTLRSVAELTGIRAGRLARLNRLEKNAALTNGQLVKIK